MKFDTPATTNPIDRLKVVGQPTERIEGPLKTSGQATYAYEQHEAAANQAYGFMVDSAIAKGRIKAIHLGEAKAARAKRSVLIEAFVLPENDTELRIRRRAATSCRPYTGCASRDGRCW